MRAQQWFVAADYSDVPRDGWDGWLLRLVNGVEVPWHGDRDGSMRSSLASLLDEIKGGAIYGSPDKCCVCGGSNNVLRFQGGNGHYCHRQDNEPTACEKARVGVDWDDHETASILTARRLLSERAAIREVEGKQDGIGVTVRPDTHIVARHEVRHTPRGTMTEIRLEKVDPMTCARPGCRGIYRPMPDHDGHHRCDGCGSTMRVINPVTPSPAPAAEVKTCGTCGHKTCSAPRDDRLPAFPGCWHMKTPPTATPPTPAKRDPYSVQREKETHIDAVMALHNEQFFLTVTKPRGLAYLEEMRRQERRHRILMGLERGPETRLIGTCGDWPSSRGPR